MSNPIVEFIKSSHPGHLEDGLKQLLVNTSNKASIVDALRQLDVETYSVGYYLLL
jgi:hypothetical protein